jgi:hypothetical protein
MRGIAGPGALALLSFLLVGCGGDAGTAPDDATGGGTQGGGDIAAPALGLGPVPDRFTSELTVSGNVAYTGTWGRRGTLVGNVLNVWNVAGAVPVFLRGITVGPEPVTTLGDVQVSDDGKLLAVATEQVPYGSLRLFDLTQDPANPRLLSVYAGPNVRNGVHTAELVRVAGRLYAFLSIDPAGSQPARLVILDLGDPAAPVEIFSETMGNPFVHDVFVRDGILFTALWNDGLTLWDVGGLGKGSPSSPVKLGNVVTVGGQVHNVWWYHAADGSRRYAFVGEEGPGRFGVDASGDIHVVDLSDFANPREVAFLNIPGAGTHNFSMDETRGILFAAYYNAGVRAIDVTGDLGKCTDAQRSSDGRCDLGLMEREVAHWLAGSASFPYVWGVWWGGGRLFASDMLNGLYRLDTAGVRP